MATIKFFIQSKNNPAGIYARLKEGRDIDAKAKTKYVIDPTEWSVDKAKPKLRNAELKRLADDLDILSVKIKNDYNEAITDGKEIDTSWLKKVLSPESNSSVPEYLVDYVDYYLLLKSSSISPNTIKKVKSYKNLLVEFEKCQKKHYKIKEVDSDFQIVLATFGTKNNYGINYISGVLHYVKILCRHANKQGVSISRSLASLSITKTKTTFTYLTKEEIAHISKVDLQHDYLQNARDWLIISCDTAQRVSDFMDFTESQIRDGNGRRYLEFMQKKTKKIVSVAIMPRVESILAKRDGRFPRKTSDVKYNLYVKEVCKIAGLTQLIDGAKKCPETNRMIYGMFPKHELITSHIGRRSWATNHFGEYANSLLMSWTGHAYERDFLNYIGKSNTDVSNHLADLLYNSEQ